jgi:flavin-dependent dehydrogenase
MEMNHYDLVIVGGGPAGTAAAITAARSGHRVLLLERGQFPRHKVCGEFISGEAFGTLRELLGPDQQYLLEDAVRTSQTRLFTESWSVTFPIAPAASITRYELDLALWRSAESAGADCRQNVTVQAILPGTEMYEISTADGTFAARTVINASGRWSNLQPREAAHKRKSQGWLGLKAHFRPLHIDHRMTIDLYFFSGGYCGVQPLADGMLNVCAMVRTDIATRLDDVFAQHPDLHARSRNWVRTTGVVATSPLIFRSCRPEHDGMLCVGDAAAFIDPFVGDGISLALRTGVLASETVKAVLVGDAMLDQAMRRYRGEYMRRFAKPIFIASLLRKLLDSPGLIRRLAFRSLRLPHFNQYLFRSTR